MLLLLQKLYIVCDVALFVIANKSTACHLDSPKDPVLPSKFFIVQDKAMHMRTHTHTHVNNVFIFVGLENCFKTNISGVNPSFFSPSENGEKWPHNIKHLTLLKNDLHTLVIDKYGHTLLRLKP